MAIVKIDDTTLTNIADKIREKNKETAFYKPREMPDAIDRIRTATEPKIEPLTVTANGTYDNADIDGYKPVVVNVPDIPADIKPIDITANGTYTATDCDGYSPITVNVAGAPTAEELTITDNCTYKFAYSGWDWVIDKYGDMISTKDITNATYMFYESKLKTIPFDINCKDDYVCPLTEMFHNATKLEYAPTISKCKMKGDAYLFAGCERLREVPETFGNDFNWSVIDGNQSTYPDSRGNLFSSCYSLRSVPMEYLNHGGPNCTSTSYSVYYNLFHNCYALDEVIGLPVPHKNATWTSNFLGNTVNKCYRLKNLTFALDPETNAPYVVKWKSQNIDLRTVGFEPVAVNPSALSGNPVAYARTNSKICTYNSGIAPEKAIVDDVTYQALKDDPDSFVLVGGSASASPYSRYNHDSAVATINSLPDTSAYLATAGGTNTIQFKGSCGSATDGGAINTLTEEEIAVATAKGWTVTLS